MKHNKRYVRYCTNFHQAVSCAETSCQFIEWREVSMKNYADYRRRGFRVKLNGRETTRRDKECLSR